MTSSGRQAPRAWPLSTARGTEPRYSATKKVAAVTESASTLPPETKFNATYMTADATGMLIGLRDSLPDLAELNVDDEAEKLLRNGDPRALPAEQARDGEKSARAVAEQARDEIAATSG